MHWDIEDIILQDTHRNITPQENEVLTTQELTNFDIEYDMCFVSKIFMNHCFKTLRENVYSWELAIAFKDTEFEWIWQQEQALCHFN